MQRSADPMDELTPVALAAVPDEPHVDLLAEVLRVLGPVRPVEALTVEANGGMRTQDGSRRRTKGGVFFYLVRGRVSPRERQHSSHAPRCRRTPRLRSSH